MSSVAPAPTVPEPLESPEERQTGRRVAQTTTTRRIVGVIVLAVALAITVVMSLAVGAKSTPWSTVFESFLSYDRELTDHLIVRELRVPRTALGLLVGAALGAAGALMQGVTRNPLADPGLLGVNAGAAFAVVLAIWAFGVSTVLGLVWFAFIGAAIASVAVYLLGTVGRGGATPVRLALAGAALASLLGALTGAVTLLDQATLDQFRFWAVGSLSGRPPEVGWQILPFVVVGLLLAVAVARQLNAMALGDEAARSLGTKINTTRAFSVLSITLLCGCAVAAAGPIGFVGLVVPHMMRVAFGPDQRWLIPASAFAGAALILFCDTLGRIVARPGEIQVGIMTAAIGGPVFVILVRRVRMAQL
ncbi:MAG: iron ABC transporter permease [Ilumatobacteraceae bacterium]|nr:iron ABC transporter permease [Ilumatobacteraceae bacterium]